MPRLGWFNDVVPCPDSCSSRLQRLVLVWRRLARCRGGASRPAVLELVGAPGTCRPASIVRCLCPGHANGVPVTRGVCTPNQDALPDALRRPSPPPTSLLTQPPPHLSSASGCSERRAVFWTRGAVAWNKLRCSAAGVGRVTLGKGLLVVRCVGFWISKASSCRGSRSHRRRAVRPPERQRPRLGRSGSGRGRRLGKGGARGRWATCWHQAFQPYGRSVRPT